MPRRRIDVKKLDANLRANPPAAPELAWFAPHQTPLELAGFPWFETDRVYRRLPLHPPRPLPPAVDTLANCTAGGQIRFQTDSNRIVVKARLRSAADMVHMPATGQCGFDSYVGDSRGGPPLFCKVTKYDVRQAQYECDLGGFQRRALRAITLNFPLYQGVEEVRVGLDADARVLPPPPFRIRGRIVAYGTSITQGGCACRPGMAYTNILSRWLDAEVVNLGFSGNGRGDPEVAEAMAKIARVACFILDYEANVDLERLRATLPEFIRILRAAHPAAPILVVSRILFAGDLIKDCGPTPRLNFLRLERAAVERCRKQGDRNIHFFDGAALLGAAYADECTVDGAHPTDLGFLRMAEGLAPVLRRILKA